MSAVGTKRAGIDDVQSPRQPIHHHIQKAPNCRSACRARRPATFCSKMGIVEEQLDESLYWMELIIESSLITAKRLAPLMKEGEELLAMTVASITTARKRK